MARCTGGPADAAHGPEGRDTRQGFVHVAFVDDTFARRIVGWRVLRTAPACFVLDALEQALHERRPAKGGGLIHHAELEGPAQPP